jgi:hypothetical protein
MRRSQVAYLAVISAISLGKERLVQVRGPKTKSSQQSMGSVLPLEQIHLRKVGVLERYNDDIPSDRGPRKGSQTACVFRRPTADQAPSSERRRRFVPTLYESRKADGSVGNTIKKQKLMQASCEKVPTLTPVDEARPGYAWPSLVEVERSVRPSG